MMMYDHLYELHIMASFSFSIYSGVLSLLKT